ncbi:SMI1/KNR4 family protein [Lysobacter korlensis]|uniref:SMI1/KNR4 family protein n=1 Tax=Lysobacter korlensis TaxID=553636 RepID=A0ABV6RPY7_9GAMM
MMTLSQKLAALMYRPYIDTDRHDPAVFANLPQIVGYPIPEEYMDFLRDFPSTGMFDVEGDVIVKGVEQLPGNHDGRYAVSMLFAACSDERYDLMEIARRPLYGGDTPRYVLQIGDNEFGNAFCLDLRRESFGKVYYWDHESGADETGLYLVADDFTSFVRGLDSK